MDNHLLAAIATSVVTLLGLFLQGLVFSRRIAVQTSDLKTAGDAKIKELEDDLKEIASYKSSHREVIERILKSASFSASAARTMVEASCTTNSAPALIVRTRKFLEDIKNFLDEAKDARSNSRLVDEDLSHVSAIENAVVTLFLALDLDLETTSDLAQQSAYKLKLSICLGAVEVSLEAFKRYARSVVVPKAAAA